MELAKVKIEYLVNQDALKEAVVEALEKELEDIQASATGVFANAQTSKLADFLTENFPSEDCYGETAAETAIRLLRGLMFVMEPLEDAKIAYIAMIVNELNAQTGVRRLASTAVAEMLGRIIQHQFLYKE